MLGEMQNHSQDLEKTWDDKKMLSTYKPYETLA